jgi:hypothetical protein
VVTCFLYRVDLDGNGDALFEFSGEGHGSGNG